MCYYQQEEERKIELEESKGIRDYIRRKKLGLHGSKYALILEILNMLI